MEAFLKNAIKNIFWVLIFLFVGIVTSFDWRFWLLLLLYVLRPFIEELAHRLNYRLKNLAEKLRQNRLQNRPPH